MKAVTLISSFLFACLWCMGLAHAEPQGRETLRNGAVLVWSVSDASAPRLSLSVPAFARWKSKGFAAPIAIRIGGSALASIDAWEVAFYRSGDTRFNMPLHQIRGTALSLSEPISWDGIVENGPALRPGETVMAVFNVRDVAGNIDRAEPQEILVARYVMRREKRRIGGLEAGRDAAFASGEVPNPRNMPTRGHSIDLRIENWPEDDEPLLAGVPMRRQGSVWVLRQTLPSGAYDLVVQVARSMLSGFRAIPVGAARVTIPADKPLLARVKGTGGIDRINADGIAPDGLYSDGLVDGGDAARLVMVDRQISEDRLALALVDPTEPAALAKDRRKRRSLVVLPDARAAQWAGQGVPTSATRPPSPPRSRSVTVRFTGFIKNELILPHTDIVRGSLIIEPEDGTARLSAIRDFFANPAQGRILLTENALANLRKGQNTGLRVRYEVQSYAPRLMNMGEIVDGGISYNVTWTAAQVDRYGAEMPDNKKGGLIGRILDWFGG